jgi:tRNA A-37 threonylcarbamoyl transferase component Bud32
VDNRSSAEVAFFAALERPGAAERAAYLDEVCANDGALRRRVEALLNAHAQVGQFLERPVAEAEGVAALGAGESAAADLSFLAPSAEPGSLGRLDHYEVLEVVGKGGTGVVLRARDTKLLRVVALKVLAAPLAASGTARRRFAREARAAAAVRDDHVVAIHAVRDDAPLPYLVMEFIDGCNLETQLRKGGPLEVKEVLRIGMQVASGLAAAHRLGLIHRDVKPANILLENGVQRVKLTDFGLARAADDASLTQTGLIAGTPLYMAPEQAAGEPLDARADLFSLGSVLYELCTGRPAFRAPTTVAVIRRVCDEAPRPIREVNADVPEPLWRLVERLHAKKPADRPVSAAEVADLLAGQLADLNSGRSREPSGTASGPARLAGPTRRRWRWAAAALVILLAGLGAGEATGVTQVRGTVTRLFSPQDTPVKEAEPLPPASAWERSVAALPAEEQVEAVARRLKELNPHFDGAAEPAIRDGVVVGLRFKTDRVVDLSPVRALARLESLECCGTVDRQGEVTDLSRLRGLPLKRLIVSDNHVSDLSPLRDMPLEELSLARNWGFRDLTPLKGLPLRFLDCSHTGVADLSPLKGMKLKVLWCDQATLVSDLTPLRGMALKELRVPYTQVSDLEPLRGMPLELLSVIETPVADLSPLRGMALKELNLTGSKVTDLSPIRGMPLTWLRLAFRPGQDAEIVRSLTTLQNINDRPAAEFWKEVDGQ